MDNITLRNLFIRDKGFLKSLYDNTTVENRRILSYTSDTQLNTLLKYLHVVSNGQIPMSKNNFDQIVNHKKLSLIKRHTEKKANLIASLHMSRDAKLKFLNQLSKIYNPILYALFNES